MQLELAHGDLEAIDSRYRNPEDQLEQVLAKWLNRGEATWRQLSEALCLLEKLPWPNKLERNVANKVSYQ